MLTPATVLHCEGHPVRRITLAVAPGYHFVPGQYLCVHHPDGTVIPFSIASTPAVLPSLHLHFKPTPGQHDSACFEALLNAGEMQVSEAMGDVRCPLTPLPLLVIAGGTGSSQAFSCLHARAEAAVAAPTTLLWCADSDAEIFDVDTLAALPQTAVHVCVDPRRTDANAGLAWVRQNVARDSYANILLCGSPPFVYAMTDALHALGVDPQRLQADVYSYAPRS